MSTVTTDKKLSDITVGELKSFIKEAIYEIIDPDNGLELRPEIEEELRKSLKQKNRGEGISLEEVKKKLRL
ncbi:MAG: hypothetical protein FVQ77_16220 [Cytophagales bacterium]|nr:hypothetical protein [Cytophagales bacterium]